MVSLVFQALSGRVYVNLLEANNMVNNGVIMDNLRENLGKWWTFSPQTDETLRKMDGFCPTNIWNRWGKLMNMGDWAIEPSAKYLWNMGNMADIIGFNHPKNGGVGCFDWGTHHWQNGSKMNNTYIFVIFVCIGWWLGWYSDIWLTYKYGWYSDWYVYNIIFYMCYNIIKYNIYIMYWLIFKYQ